MGGVPAPVVLASESRRGATTPCVERGLDLEPQFSPYAHTVAEIPIVCSLEAEQMPERLQEWEAVSARVEARRPTPDGVELCLPLDPDLLGAVATVAAKEVACCSFFTFTLTITASAAWLAVAAPDDAVPIVRELFGPVDV